MLRAAPVPGRARSGGRLAGTLFSRERGRAGGRREERERGGGEGGGERIQERSRAHARTNARARGEGGGERKPRDEAPPHGMGVGICGVRLLVLAKNSHARITCSLMTIDEVVVVSTFNGELL